MKPISKIAVPTGSVTPAQAGGNRGRDHGTVRPGLIGPDSPQVAATETARYSTGRVVPAVLDATAGPVDLGGVTVRTWSRED